MKAVLLLSIGFTVGMWFQYRSDSAFVAAAFHSSTFLLEENVKQGAAQLDMCEAYVKGAR